MTRKRRYPRSLNFSKFEERTIFFSVAQVGVILPEIDHALQTGEKSQTKTLSSALKEISQTKILRKQLCAHVSCECLLRYFYFYRFPSSATAELEFQETRLSRGFINKQRTNRQLSRDTRKRVVSITRY